VTEACPPAEDLVAFVDGQLDDHAQSAVETHIDGCGSCRSGLAAIVARGSGGGATSEWTLGRYRIDGVLGAGGMGIVYRGWDPSLGRPVAVKVVRAGGDDALTQRLAREAQSLARLNHPNACQIYDVGRDGDEVWIAMELVDGVTLRAWLAGQPGRGDVLDVLVAAGRGLAAAHGAGLVHRDVKPENVLVDRAGRAVVSDFGLARTDGDPSATRTGVVVGTPAYMAPEQLDGSVADARSDQYSFAVMAHEAITGARPRPRNAASPVLPAPLRAALARALADDPARRYPSLGELLDALSTRRSSRRVLGVGLALAAIAVVATIAIGSLSTSDRVPAPAVDPAAAPVTLPRLVLAPATAAVPPAATASAAAPVDAGVARPRPDAARDAAPDAAVVAAVDAAVAPAGSTSTSGAAPRFGSTRNAPKPSHTTTLAEAERIFAGGLCTLPGAPATKYAQPVDWGKVTRVADAVIVIPSGAHGYDSDARLYEITGQRRRYVIDGFWGMAVHGEPGAHAGDTVALCPSDDVAGVQLPGDWTGPLTRTQVAVRVGGPPNTDHVPIVGESQVVATAHDRSWPFADHVLVYARSGGRQNSGRFMMGGWELELDDTTQHRLDPLAGAWIVADKPRWLAEVSAQPDRYTTILHASAMRASLFPPP
jgi:tRNA A-37 threonylcarbamoyl transferase component Bud32